MGSGAATQVWVLTFTLIYCCWAAPRLSCPCPHSLQDAAPTASGYLPINQSSGTKMFFAFYEATQRISTSRSSVKLQPLEPITIHNVNNDDVPILLWLQGGPGCSGMVGNFFEIGPWRVGEDQCLHRNPAPWNRIFGLLFLDSPLGSGFSSAPLVEDIPVDQAGVARDIYTALQGFYDQYPALRSRPFYVAGESYGGKYVPAVATYILEKRGEQGISSFVQRKSSQQLRLDGIAIGNGLTHPIVQVETHASTAYFMGLIDENEKDEVDALAAKAVAYIQEENWLDAHSARVELLDYLQNVTGLATLLDVRRTTSYHTTANGTDYLSLFMNKEEVQTSLLNADRLTWMECSDRVRQRMAADTTKSTMHMVESLLNQSIPVLLYQGQFDLRDGVASNDAWIQLLQWDGRQSFNASKRKVWNENNVRIGNVRSYGLLTHVVIANAGHLVPADQAYASQCMIESWVSSVGIA